MKEAHEQDVDLADLKKALVYEQDWNEASLDLLQMWIHKCDTESQMHLKAARSKRCRSRSVAIPNVIFGAAATGLSFYATSDPCIESDVSLPQVCASVFTAIATILSSVSNVFMFDTSIKEHIYTASRFGELSKRARVQLALPIERKGDVEVVIDGISSTFSSIQESAPLS